MGIITLTTDMGLRDHYVSSLKGAIYSNFPDARIIDISHQVSAFNISQAAYFLKNAQSSFPEGTVHVIGVDAEPNVNFTEPEKSELPMIMKYADQYYVGVNNGIFSLILGSDKYQELWQMEDVLSQPELMNFPTKNILIPAACKIAMRNEFNTFCSPADRLKRVIPLSPVLEGHTIKAAVIHIDHYGNVITNVHKNDFYRLGKNVPFVIYFRQKEYYIDKISIGFNDVPAGEKVALFNDSGYLEIAINKGTPDNGGGASNLFGLRLKDIIRIEFTPRGSRQTLESFF
jgi:S-adenosylmethionine hydrolase